MFQGHSEVKLHSGHTTTKRFFQRKDQHNIPMKQVIYFFRINSIWLWQLCILFLLSFSATAQAPANDNCASATLLTSATSCTNTNGTVANATNSGVPVGSCTGTPDDDVWYRFITASTDHTITLSNIGSNLNTSGARLQLFEGTCAGLISVACGTTSIAATTLARNTTYYIRVYSAGGTVLTTNAGFRICVTHPAAPVPQIDFGKSFINVSKPTGGTIETGDVLEMRASVVVRSGAFDSCSFNDIIPAGTTFIPGTIQILTNEGKIYKQFTDAQFDASNDQGWISGSNININLGYRSVDQPATVYRRGRIRNNNGHKPSYYSSSCIMVASYRVTVTAASYTTINMGGGNITYTTSPPTISTFSFPSSPVMVYPNLGFCSNSVGTNSLGTETNGTFGSGNPRNRAPSANVPAGYTYATFTCSSPQDYFYGIANNTGGGVYSTSNAWPKPDGNCSATPTTHRVFTYWDIIGDHTGAANQITGNPAADTTGGSTGGYMLIVNAAYRIDSAFDHTISNLCPNTYYEISCWMRNICSKCGCDSNGVGANSGGYIPTGTGDSSGVRPNITFALDGVRYYTSGDLPYSGQWVKKGFTFLTGPAQTSFTMRYYNNAPGGGGNDWALDDISVATCTPNMTYSPSLNPNICDSNIITLSDTIRSFFSNYIYFKWQRSTDGGASWTDVTAPAGPVVPYWNGTTWEYVVSYTLLPAFTQLSNSGDMYRVVVATTLSNLSDINCRFTDAGGITLNILDCDTPLSSSFLSFSGKKVYNHSFLEWSTTGENEAVTYNIEKSNNASIFETIGSVPGRGSQASASNNYSFTDPVTITATAFYRLRIVNAAGNTKFSNTVVLHHNDQAGLSFVSVTNPFDREISFQVSSSESGILHIMLMDQTGRIVAEQKKEISNSLSRISLYRTESLPVGAYYLRLFMNGKSIQKKLIRYK